MRTSATTAADSRIAGLPVGVTVPSNVKETGGRLPMSEQPSKFAIDLIERVRRGGGASIP